MAVWAERTCGKVAAREQRLAKRWLAEWVRWQLAERMVPHFRADKPRGTTRERDRLCNPGFHCREIKP